MKFLFHKKEDDKLPLEELAEQVEKETNAPVPEETAEVQPETARERKASCTVERDEKRIPLNGGILLLFAGLLILISVAVSFLAADSIYKVRLREQTKNKIILDGEQLNPSEVAKLQDVLDFIESNYGLDYDINDLLEGAVAGVMTALNDPYSYYIEPGALETYQNTLDGTYGEIGFTFGLADGAFAVTGVTAGSSAEKAGLQAGDVLVSVDGTPATELSENLLRQKFSTAGQTVSLTIRHPDGTEATISITADVQKRNTVYFKKLENKISYIRIMQFDDDTGTEFACALQEAEKEASGLILDLRSNRGGYEREASKVADLLLGEGLIAYSQDRNGNRISEIYSDAAEIKLPMVLLVDGTTASASELVAGAFRDFGKGKIVGTVTYGKALGQVIHAYPEDGSGIVLTVARYFTPSGACIHGVGITPDVVVELEPECRERSPEELTEEQDVQLSRAIEELKAQMG